MKAILFCQNAYAFGILTPIKDILVSQKHDYLWFIPEKLLASFPHKKEPFTTSMLNLQFFASTVIFVPGNEVPYYLTGVKVQIFHGLAGEKKGHFHIRHYFDLYLTQGPYFTKKFKALRKKFKDFEVAETGWPKLDVFTNNKSTYVSNKETLLKKYKTDKIILFAPTFSPSLTSAPHLLKEIEDLAVNTGYLIFIKFHDLMNKKWILAYQELSHKIHNIHFKEEKNITKFLLQADILISDTSSVIYEFLLLNKPAISYKTIAEDIYWDNSNTYTNLTQKVLNNLVNDPFSKDRAYINKSFHPYRDGKSALRMVETVKKYISKNGIPKERKLSFARKLKINSIFGKPVDNLWDGNKKNKISALLITYNEVFHIDSVLENIKFADEIIVVDSFSTDGTIEKIKKHPNVKLIQRPFKNYTDQKSFALEQASNDWVLFMDADERVTDALKNEILKTINNNTVPAVAYYFSRTFMFKNRKLRFSGWQSDKNYRLFRKSKVHFDTERIVHETLIVNGDSATLKNKLIHYSYKNYEDYKGKMIKYGKMKAAEEVDKKYTPNLYHFIIRPLYRFVNHYIIRLGVLDGKKGVTISYLNALGVYHRFEELKRLQKKK